MEMKKVIFDSRAWNLDASPYMHDYFLNNPELGINPISVYHNTIDYQKFANKNSSINLNDYYHEGYGKYSINELSEFEKKYNLDNLWFVVYFDRFLKDKPKTEIYNQLSYYIFAWETILKNEKPDYIVTETVTGAWNYLPYALSPYFNTVYLGYLFTKNTNKYFFTRELYGCFPEMDKRFNDLLLRNLNDEELKLTNEFISSFKEKHMVPIYMKTTSALPKIHNFFNPYRICINIIKDLKTFFNVKNDYKIDYRLNGYKRDFQRLIRIIYTKSFNVFKKPTLSEDYILYPLQYQPEATTDIWSAYYTDQLQTIQHLAKSLPIGCKLYVKEHYAVLGSKPISFYKKLEKLPNVVLIDPWLGINELIKKSKAVAILTGTTGLEAIIWEKPVIIFGRVFFDIYPDLLKVKKIDELPSLINQALYDFKIDQAIYKKYIYAYIASGYEGRFHGGNLTNEEIVQHCQNLVFEINKEC